MRLGGSREERIRRQRARLAKEGYEPPAQDPLRNVQVRCFKDGALIAELPPGTVFVLLAPDDAPSNHRDTPGVVFLQCRRCKEKRALIQHPGGPPRMNGSGGRKSP